MRVSAPILLMTVLVLGVDAVRTKPTGPPGDAPSDAAMYRGGHAENQVVDEEACEFMKTHDAKEMGRFAVEEQFLSRASASPMWSPLVPKLKRVQEINGRPFMVLENVNCHMKRPVIADFKLGLQSWTPDFPPGVRHSSDKKRAKMEKLDSRSTTKQLGVRITSIQMPDIEDLQDQENIEEAGFVSTLGGRVAVKSGLTLDPRQKWIAGGNLADFSTCVEKYLPTPQLRRQFVEKLRPFLEVFEKQTTYRFTGGSLFVFYDAVGATGEHPKLDMRMIDFPHTLGSPEHEFGEIDHGVLQGLRSLKEMATKLGLEEADDEEEKQEEEEEEDP